MHQQCACPVAGWSAYARTRASGSFRHPRVQVSARSFGNAPSATPGGFKGQGKFGLLGLPLPLPVAAESHPDEQPTPIPEPLVAYRADEITGYFGYASTAYYRIFREGFWNGENIWDVRKGTRVLWKGVCTGPSGGESTKVEYFAGFVHEWQE